MLITGPFTPVLDTPLSEQGPYTGTPNAVAVQVQNVSGFHLVVSSAGTRYAVPPMQSATIPVDETQQITVTPIVGVTGTGQIVLVWLLPRDTPPVPDGAIGSTLVNDETSAIYVQNTTNAPLYTIAPPSPPYSFVTSTLLPMTGAAQQLTNQALAYGLILLADPANTGRIRISNYGVVAQGSAQIGPGQGIVIPVANASDIAVEGTVVGDLLSYWGA